ncbi:RICIN domain-containing protein [Kribbella sp. CA-294648]|uniref:RICIN domain-containing protein n=1 Tax=Kribbella sp. CA-294648 TaxID=3239948 RepID=UPI003D8F38E3
MVQQPCAAVASQQWILRAALNTPQLEGRYKVSPVISNYVLDIKDCIPDRGIR